MKAFPGSDKISVLLDKTVSVIGFTEKYHAFQINFNFQVSDNH